MKWALLQTFALCVELFVLQVSRTNVKAVEKKDAPHTQDQPRFILPANA